MARTLKAVLLALLCFTPVLAESLKPITELSPRILSQVGQSWGTGFFLPGSPYLLVFGEYDLISDSTTSWLFRLRRGHYQLCHESLVDGEWGRSTLDYFPLVAGSHSKVALGQSGCDFQLMQFPGGLFKAPEYVQLYAGHGASPWAVPGYQLNVNQGRLVIELYFSSPDGISSGVPHFEWTGREWRRSKPRPPES